MKETKPLIVLLLFGALLYGIYLTQVADPLGGPANGGAGMALVGKKAPLIEVVDQKKQKLNMKELEGKVVLLHFWATWCPPCVEEFPHLNEFQKKFSKDSFVLLAVSLDEDPQAVESFKKKITFDFPIYFDPEQQTVERYGTYKLPESFLIGSDGQVVLKIVGPQNWSDPSWVNKTNQYLKK